MNAAPAHIVAAAVMMAGACLAGCGGGDPQTFAQASIVPSPTQPAVTEQLDAVALTHDAVAIRYQAVDAIGDRGGEEAIFLLQQALLDPEPDIREAAIDALTDIGTAESVTALGYALNDEDVLVREAAVHGLGQIGGTAATGLLQFALTDTDDDVRDAAAAMLAEATSDAFADEGSSD